MVVGSKFASETDPFGGRDIRFAQLNLSTPERASKLRSRIIGPNRAVLTHERLGGGIIWHVG